MGGSEESWFKYDRLTKYRKIKNPEFYPRYSDETNVFYYMSMDVGRIQDASPVCIFRVNQGPDRFVSTLVNLVVLGRTEEAKTFAQQATELKLLIELYNPREVLIDTNGLTKLAHLKPF